VVENLIVLGGSNPHEHLFLVTRDPVMRAETRAIYCIMSRASAVERF
jgi:hypothetical protein